MSKSILLYNISESCFYLRVNNAEYIQPTVSCEQLAFGGISRDLTSLGAVLYHNHKQMPEKYDFICEYYTEILGVEQTSKQKITNTSLHRILYFPTSKGALVELGVFWRNPRTAHISDSTVSLDEFSFAFDAAQQYYKLVPTLPALNNPTAFYLCQAMAQEILPAQAWKLHSEHLHLQDEFAKLKQQLSEIEIERKNTELKAADVCNEIIAQTPAQNQADVEAKCNVSATQCDLIACDQVLKRQILINSIPKHNRHSLSLQPYRPIEHTNILSFNSLSDIDGSPVPESSPMSTSIASFDFKDDSDTELDIIKPICKPKAKKVKSKHRAKPQAITSTTNVAIAPQTVASMPSVESKFTTLYNLSSAAYKQAATKASTCAMLTRNTANQLYSYIPTPSENVKDMRRSASQLLCLNLLILWTVEVVGLIDVNKIESSNDLFTPEFVFTLFIMLGANLKYMNGVTPSTAQINPATARKRHG